MPKDTFFNLGDAKKQRIFGAAVKEFSTRRFSEASINQVIKTADIPRGSFYQYFHDKEDLYLYMFLRMIKEKRQIIRQTETTFTGADVFETCMQTIRATLAWSRAKPEYHAISMLMELDDSEFISRLRNASAEEIKRISDHIDHDKMIGKLKSDTDTDLLADMIYTLTYKECLKADMDETAYLKRVSDVFRVLKLGIAR